MTPTIGDQELTGTPNEPWHLDKKVPIALIFTLLVQSAGIVWFAATMNARVEVLEKEVARQSSTETSLTQSLLQLGSDTRERLIRLEIGQENIVGTMSRIEDSLGLAAPAPSPSRRKPLQ